MKKYFSLITAVLLFSFSLSSQALTTKEDKISYAHGFSLAEGVQPLEKALPDIHINPEILYEGFLDFIQPATHTSPKMTLEEAMHRSLVFVTAILGKNLGASAQDTKNTITKLKLVVDKKDEDKLAYAIGAFMGNLYATKRVGLPEINPPPFHEGLIDAFRSLSSKQPTKLRMTKEEIDQLLAESTPKSKSLSSVTE